MGAPCFSPITPCHHMYWQTLKYHTTWEHAPDPQVTALTSSLFKNTNCRYSYNVPFLQCALIVCTHNDSILPILTRLYYRAPVIYVGDSGLPMDCLHVCARVMRANYICIYITCGLPVISLRWRRPLLYNYHSHSSVPLQF